MLCARPEPEEGGGQGWIARKPAKSIEKQRVNHSNCGYLCSSFAGRRKMGSVAKAGLELWYGFGAAGVLLFPARFKERQVLGWLGRGR